MALIHGFDIATTTPPHSGRMVPRHCSYDRFYPDGRRAGLTLSSLTLHRASHFSAHIPRFRFEIFSSSLYVQAHFHCIHFRRFNLARIQENRCIYATSCRDEISSSRCKAHGIASEWATTTLGHAFMRPQAERIRFRLYQRLLCRGASSHDVSRSCVVLQVTVCCFRRSAGATTVRLFGPRAGPRRRDCSPDEVEAGATTGRCFKT